MKRTDKRSILGYGIRFPLERGDSDFVVDSGEDLIFSSLPYIIETQANSPDIQGEIPWDSSFGTQVQRLKHKNIVRDDEVLQELARFYLIDGLELNEPRIIVQDTEVSFEETEKGNRLTIQLKLIPIENDNEANLVSIPQRDVVQLTLAI